MTILFHASPVNGMSLIKPQRTLSNNDYIGNFVFATANKNIAAMYLATKGIPVMINSDSEPNRILICSDEKQYIKNDKGGSIYSVSDSTFEQSPQLGLESSELVSSHAVVPIKSEVFSSSIEAMIESNIAIYFVDTIKFNDILKNKNEFEVVKNLQPYRHFTVEPASKTDIDNLLLIKNDALRFKLSQGDEAWETQPFTPPEIQPGIDRGITYIAKLGGVAAGTVDLVWQDQHNWGEQGLDKQAGYIHSLAVSSEFRGQKLGEAILEWSAEKVQGSGRSLLRLDCPSANKMLCEYYESQGFLLVGENERKSSLYERLIT